MDIEKRIEKLRYTIKGHDCNYHILGEPSISKYEYEELQLELRTLEREHQLDQTNSSIDTSKELV